MAKRTMRCAKKGSSKKGCASKTHKGRKDYTTKKTSKYFDRKGHRSKHAEGKKTKRRPYSKKGRKSRKSRIRQKAGNKAGGGLIRQIATGFALGV